VPRVVGQVRDDLVARRIALGAGWEPVLAYFARQAERLSAGTLGAYRLRLPGEGTRSIVGEDAAALEATE
jgi:hypothetical protein